jgi:SAM-dependent methyltransferase
MLLTIATTHRPAIDLGYLLHKNPARVHETPLPFGTAVMFYPELTEHRATFALALDIDPVALVRGRGRGDAGIYDQYVSDRPYAASSFLSVAIAKTLRNALGGSSKERSALAATEIPLRATVLPLPVRGSEGLVERLFHPLGYETIVEPIALDEQLAWLGPEWSRSPYVKLTLSATCRLSSLLSHLYVLIPVLDRHKHYFVDRGEIDKLLAKGESWLGTHPEREFIALRYLRNKRSASREVLERLAADEPVAEEVVVDETVAPSSTDPAIADAVAASADAAEVGETVVETRKDAAEEALEKPIRLHDQRLDRVAQELRDAGVRRVVDLGCGSGKLMKRLLDDRQFTEILGVDVSTQALEITERRLRLDRLPERQRNRVRLLQGALTYRDRRIEAYDAIALVEVIEHVDADRLPALERIVFEFARPRVVVVTTPNVEYNSRFEGMAPGQMRHADHRFEWSRGEFRSWCETVASRFGYRADIGGIGTEDPDVGHPSQIAVFQATSARSTP